MPYYQDQVIYDELVINELYDSGTKELKPIDIFNNTEIILKLDGISVKSSITEKFTNPESVSLLRIDIEWGDGVKETITPKNYQSTSFEYEVEMSNWYTKRHTYHFYEEVAKTDLYITVYNTLNDKVVIKQPINLKYKSISEENVRYELISANITNDNTVSYVINDANTKQMIVVNSVAEDWLEDKSFVDKTKLFGTNVVNSDY